MKSTKKKEQLEKIFNEAASGFNHRKALNIFLKLEGKYRNDEDFVAKLGFLYDHIALNKKGLTRKKYEDYALRIYRRILKRNPKSRQALWGIGRVYWHRGNKKAVFWAKKALRGSKGCERMLYINNLALVYMKLGLFKKSEGCFLKIRKMRCSTPGRKQNFLFNRVILYQQWGKDVKSLKKVAKEAWPICIKLPRNLLDSKVWRANCRLLNTLLRTKASNPL